ncbi:DNRLRE domain-containing protein [Snuella lapsa]|uniref:DNRLRE domain-containing protein n=1 Tax=Snuella lapsa TaxID=870481 RepID=A0ABP6YMQ0_9FLAO
MKSVLRKCLFAIILSLSIVALGQTTNDFSPTKDNTIYSESNNSNGLGMLFSGKTDSNNGNNNRRALIQFDISSIPSSSMITEVTLTLNVNKDAPAAGSETYNLYGLTKDWGEGSSSGGGTGAPAIAPDATWNDAMLVTSSWNSPGGDYSGTSLASLDFSGTGNFTFSSTSNLVTLVQSWLDAPSSNHGIILIGDESKSGTARRLGSKDSGVAPKLSVTWEPALSNDEFVLNNFSMYPNPNKYEIKLHFPSAISKASVKIFDSLGKEIYKTGTYSKPINVSDWSSGIYLVRVTSLGKTKTKRFVKL